ncbi:hypothetical protein ACFQY5_29450 [Paeniroseomonas aquatica]|uniref:hypothetical protein n=1 Tax=Paeniroseomonas aquatica TaxID=373043 RepID=UPI0036142EF2
MKIARVETLRADAGWRLFSFLRVTTDDGLIGWSEYNESFGSTGLSAVIEGLSPLIIGRDPTRWEEVTAWLHVMTRQSRGGLNQQAIAAIENALLDIAARARGIPVYALFGGPIRERIPVYWSHFGSYRVRNSKFMGTPPCLDWDEVGRHAAEVKALGFRGLKTNILIPGEDGKLFQYSPGFGRHAGWPELNWDNRTLSLLKQHLRVIRDAVGPEFNLHLDTNSTSAPRAFSAWRRRWRSSTSPGSRSTSMMRRRWPASSGWPPARSPAPRRYMGGGIPAVPRGLFDGCRHRRRHLERAGGIDEDRLALRRIRGELRAA